jgi:hypothetical protein
MARDLQRQRREEVTLTPRQKDGMDAAIDPSTDNPVVTERHALELITENSAAEVLGVDTVADLKDLTEGRKDRVLAIVENDTPATNNGLFRYDSSASMAEELPYIITPTDTTGRWFQITTETTEIIRQVLPGVTDIAALKAFLNSDGRRDRVLVLVEDDTTSVNNGVFRYDANSSDVENIPFLVTPTDTTGRWFQITKESTEDTENHLLHGVDDIAAMKALVGANGRADRVLVLVEDDASLPNNGLFRYDVDSSAAEELPHVVTPTDATGRWFQIATSNTKRMALGYTIKGFKLEWVSAAQIKVYPGYCWEDTGQQEIELKTSVTINAAIQGANGRAEGTLSANTWYYTFVIKNPTTGAVAGLVAITASPTLPSGYTLKRRIGMVRRNAAFLDFRQYGIGSERIYKWIENSTTTLMVLSGGGSAAYTDVDCSGLIPPTSTLGKFLLYCWGDYFYGNHIRPNGTTMADYLFCYGLEATEVECPTDSSQVIEYRVDTVFDALDIYVFGFMEEI